MSLLSELGRSASSREEAMQLAEELLAAGYDADDLTP